MRLIIFSLLAILSLGFATALPSLNVTITGAFYNGTNYIFSPDGNFYDEITITMNSSEIVKDWNTTRIFNSSLSQVKSFNSPAGSPDNISGLIKTWDGSSPDYINEVPDGFYTINTTVTDWSNNILTVQLTGIFVDRSKPKFSTYISNNLTSSDNTQVNVTLEEINLQKVILELNGTNYTVTSNISNVFYFTILSGNYSSNQIDYYWYANDSLGNLNKSSLQSFTVTQNAEVQNENSVSGDSTKDYSIKSKKQTFIFNKSSESKISEIKLEENYVYLDNSFVFAIYLLILNTVLLLTLSVLIVKSK
ncbi:hypothetical protein HYT24_03385 [Candidatus Pacearchaeota archaeon]|nr:hypothetical protein [Candidatus Pacearchaeota archaeon]